MADQETVATEDGPPPDKGGRPTLYSEAIAAEICQRMEGGETPNQIGRDPRMPSRTTFQGWAKADPDGFGVRYKDAHDQLLWHWAYETIDIADDGTNDWVERENKSGDKYMALDKEHISRSTLRVNQRMKLLSKLMQTPFGDKVIAEGKDGGPIEIKFVD